MLCLNILLKKSRRRFINFLAFNKQNDDEISLAFICVIKFLLNFRVDNDYISGKIRFLNKAYTQNYFLTRIIYSCLKKRKAY